MNVFNVLLIGIGLAMDAAALPVSAPVELEGRIQSRLYTKVTEEGSCERTAYEVSVMHLPDGDEDPPRP